MKKKYFILAFMFLCLLMGQSIFGQSFNSDYEDEGEECTNQHTYLDQSEDCFDIYVTVVEYYYCNSGFMTGTDLYESLVPKECGTVDSGNCHDPFSSAYPCYDEYIDTGDCNDYRSYAYPCYVDTGDCNDYRSYAYPCYVDSGDCTDSRSYAYPCENSACTRTCDSGYKLNEATCGCEELPPCFGSLSELDTSNAFDTNTILNSLQSFLSSFGVETDAINLLKDMKLFDPHVLSETAKSYVEASDYLGTTGDALGIGLSVAKYLDEPKTENLLRVSFDVGVLALPAAGNLTVGFIELFENRNGETLIDLLLKEASKSIEKLMGCNLGTGVHGLIF